MYPLDVGGSINYTGSLYHNGSNVVPWPKDGNGIEYVDGNVGIQTASDSYYNLNVQGQVQIYNTNPGVAGSSVILNDANLYNSCYNYFQTSDFSNGGYNMIINDSGNYDSSFNNMVQLARTENDGNQNFHMEFVNTSKSGNYGVGFGFVDTSVTQDGSPVFTFSPTPFVIWPTPQGFTSPYGYSTVTAGNVGRDSTVPPQPAITILTDGSGYVGINNIQPQTTLDVFGSALIKSQNSSVELNNLTSPYNSILTYDGSLGTQNLIINDNGSYDVSFNTMVELARTENDGNQNFHMEFVNISENGNYGVGFGFVDTSVSQYNAEGQYGSPDPFVIWPSPQGAGPYNNSTYVTSGFIPGPNTGPPVGYTPVNQPAITILMDGSGCIGINNINPGYTGLDVYGDINYTGTLYNNGSVKTFNIEHPLFPEHRLIHSCIEGPRVDLVYRGQVQLVNGSATVNMDTDSTKNPMNQGTFAALCTNPQHFLQNNDSFDRVIGKLRGNILAITCENKESSDVINWMVIAERQDAAIKSSDKTDANGSLIPEYTMR